MVNRRSSWLSRRKTGRLSLIFLLSSSLMLLRKEMHSVRIYFLSVQGMEMRKYSSTLWARMNTSSPVDNRTTKAAQLSTLSACQNVMQSLTKSTPGLIPLTTTARCPFSTHYSKMTCRCYRSSSMAAASTSK